MESNQLNHQKKVRLMGTILIWVSILSAVAVLVTLGFTGFAYGKFGSTFVLHEVFGTSPKDKAALEVVAAERDAEAEKLIQESRELLGDNFEGSRIEAEFEELKEANEELRKAEIEEAEVFDDLPTVPIDFKAIFYGTLFTTILTVTISLFLFMIGRSWRAVDPFSRRVVIGLRGLGITFWVQALVGYFFPEPDIEDMDVLIQFLNTAPILSFCTAPLISLGVVLLTLSWVIEHGQQLDESNKLTI